MVARRILCPGTFRFRSRAVSTPLPGHARSYKAIKPNTFGYASVVILERLVGMRRSLGNRPEGET